MPVGIGLVHRPARVSPEEAMDREALLVAPHGRRPWQADAMAAHDQLVTGEPVRPRMKQRHAHHRAHVAVVAQAGSPVKQFLTGMAQRSADHAKTRYERRLQGSGGQRHRFEALDGAALDAWVDGLQDAHACLSRGMLFRYSARTGATTRRSRVVLIS
jgi:hypothetical protein